YRLSAAGRPGLIFGYATLEEDTIGTGGDLLGAALDATRPSQRCPADERAPRARYARARGARSNRSVRSLIALRPSRGGAGAPWAPSAGPAGGAGWNRGLRE